MVARSIRGAVIEPAPLPEDLRIILENPRLAVRQAGVTEVAGLLGAPIRPWRWPRAKRWKGLLMRTVRKWPNWRAERLMLPPR